MQERNGKIHELTNSLKVLHVGMGVGPGVLGWRYTAGGAGVPPAPPPPRPHDQSDRGKQRTVPSGKTCRAILGTHTFGSQTPPPLLYAQQHPRQQPQRPRRPRGSNRGTSAGCAPRCTSTPRHPPSSRSVPAPPLPRRLPRGPHVLGGQALSTTETRPLPRYRLPRVHPQARTARGEGGGGRATAPAASSPPQTQPRSNAPHPQCLPPPPPHGPHAVLRCRRRCRRPSSGCCSSGRTRTTSSSFTRRTSSARRCGPPSLCPSPESTLWPDPAPSGGGLGGSPSHVLGCTPQEGGGLPSPPSSPSKCLRLTAKVLLRRLPCQEDLRFKIFGPPSARTIGGPWGEGGGSQSPPSPLLQDPPPPTPLLIHPSGALPAGMKIKAKALPGLNTPTIGRR